MMNSKAVSTTQAVFLLIVIVLSVVAVAIYLGSGASPAQLNSDVTVYIDQVKQTGNYSEPNTLNWGTISAGNTYTKTFNVTNTGNTPYNLMLITTEPAGTSQTWAFNNTALNPLSYASATLVLTLSASPQTGSYSWKLLATNGTATPTASPTPTSNPTPTPNSLQFTVQADMGITSINVTTNSNNLFTLLYSDLPATYTVTPGTNIKLDAEVHEGFVFNMWQFSDGSIPVSFNPILLNNVQGNFSITAKALPTT